MKRRSQTAAGRLRSPEDRSLPAVLLVLSVLLFACMTAALCMGRYSSLSPREALSVLLSHVLPLEGAWTENQINVVMRVRLPRVTGAMLVGGALALAGTTFQGVFRNPLVSSDMLGVSNGACIGAALSILLGLGAAEARTLGVHVRRERRIAIVCATLLTASSVCLTGTIGWVGLIMPHIARRLVGSNNVRCLPVSMLVSAIFMLIIDTAARTLTGGELPLSILTGALGAPFFALILVKQKGVE